MLDVTSALPLEVARPLRCAVLKRMQETACRQRQEKTVSNDVVPSRFAPDNRARVSGKKQRAAALQALVI